MSLDKVDIQRKITNLQKEVKALSDKVKRNSTAPDEDIETQFEVVQTAFNNLDGLFETQDDVDRMDLGRFLSTVGTSVVEAQGEHDKLSEQYLKRVRQTKYALPSVFRFPKVSAEIKFALEKTRDTGIDLLLYRNTTEAKERHQQSVTIELASVPPTQEALKQLEDESPVTELILDTMERRAVFNAVQIGAVCKRAMEPSLWRPPHE